MRRSTPIALPAWKPVSLHGSGSARASRRRRGANAGAEGRHRRVTLQRRASGTESLSLSDTAFWQPRRYWGGKRGGCRPSRQYYACNHVYANDRQRNEGEIRAGPPSSRPNAPSLKFVRIRCDDMSTATTAPTQPEQSPENPRRFNRLSRRALHLVCANDAIRGSRSIKAAEPSCMCTGCWRNSRR